MTEKYEAVPIYLNCFVQFMYIWIRNSGHGNFCLFFSQGCTFNLGTVFVYKGSKYKSAKVSLVKMAVESEIDSPVAIFASSSRAYRIRYPLVSLTSVCILSFDRSQSQNLRKYPLLVYCVVLIDPCFLVLRFWY